MKFDKYLSHVAKWKKRGNNWLLIDIALHCILHFHFTFFSLFFFFLLVPQLVLIVIDYRLARR